MPIHLAVLQSMGKGFVHNLVFSLHNFSVIWTTHTIQKATFQNNKVQTKFTIFSIDISDNHNGIADSVSF